MTRKTTTTTAFLLGAAVLLGVVQACKSGGEAEEFDLDATLEQCDSKIRASLRSLTSGDTTDYSLMPRNIPLGETAWTTRRNSPEEWCNGFWPGELWYDYELTGDTAVRRQADLYTRSLEFLSKRPAYDHDLGFLMLSSYGNAWRLTGDEYYKQVLLATADTLATLYDPRVGTLLSWPRNVEMFGGHNTIMDNMINLELLLWAADNGGGDTLRSIAIHHADRTMECAFRDDYTSYHVAVYDTLTGRFIKGMTHQGLADSTMWARGQAWAIYGYTMMFRRTGEPRYLDFAQKVADVYLHRLPSDRVPYWDFSDPAIPSAPRDASAAAVVASALLDLAPCVGGQKGMDYLDEAFLMLESLSSSAYFSGERNEALLMHSVGNMPAGSEIDASIIYADYYYMEALLKARALEQQNIPVTQEHRGAAGGGGKRNA